ncbi:MAG: hypothetical protein LBT55_07280 [Clostridiaceae bacterium]|jgi:hypothetical protein|nr:hypothetical protein [Clostridiaceae bacterium]
MEATIIAVIISSAVTVVINGVSLFLSAKKSITDSRKTAERTIVTSGRTKYLDAIREANTAFRGLAAYNSVRFSVNAPQEEFQYIPAMYTALAKLKTYLKPFYKIDARLRAQADSLASLCAEQFFIPPNDGVSLKNEIEAAADSYDKLYAQYDWAYWQYIQSQVDGVHKNSNEDYDGEYGKLQAEVYLTAGETGYSWEE